MATAQKTKDVTIDDLSAQIETLKKDIAGLTHVLGELGSAKVHQASDAARETAQRLRSEGERYAHTAGQAASEGADAALEAVRRQPVTSLAIAVGFGFLVGLVSGRR